jgi:hypothetical protein
MAYTEFYEAASRSAKSPPVRDFMAEMAKRARSCNGLEAEFTERITANRRRREGKPPKLTGAGRQWLKEADEAAREAAAQAPKLAAQLSDDDLLKFAVDDWQMEVELHDPSGHHADDRRFAKRIQRHIAETLKLAKDFLRRRGVSAPKHVKPVLLGGGISFNASFQRSVPGVGKLGSDCIAIEPSLAVLDRILTDAKQTPLSGYLDLDPEKWFKGKKPWFDPVKGLASVRFLLAKLRRPGRKLKNRARVLQDLGAIEAELVEAERKKIRFHFVMLD